MKIVIIGAGGHGKVVLDIVRAAGRDDPVGFVDADAALHGTVVGGLPVLGPVNLVPKLKAGRKIKAAIVAIGDNRIRRRYAAMLRQEGIDLVSAIHPSAIVSATATLGTNVVVAAGSVICTETVIGDSAILNTGAVVDHENVVAAAVHVAPRACLAGRVRTGVGAFIGMGANVLQCLSVGKWATVGAGAVITRDVADYATVVGVPGRQIKRADALPDD